LGHVERIPKRVMFARMEGTRIWGCPRNRLLDKVKQDLQQMGIRNWTNVSKEWDEWRRIILKAKGHYGL